MLTIPDRMQAVFAEAWALLPSIKHEAVLADVRLEDLGAVHGTYNTQTHILTLNARLFYGDNPAQVMMLDVDGNCPPKREPFTSRALHTCVHELAHAIGYATGLDDSRAWLALSGWSEDAETDPIGTARYTELRPGWPYGTSEWRYRTGGTWFCRTYSTKSPYEDFADSVAHVALGWGDFTGATGLRKLAYVRRHVWRETGARAMQAARQRWQRRLVGR